MEWNGLPSALGRLFPGHDFYAVPTPREIDSNPDRFPLDGFTSFTLTSAHEANPPEAARELVGRAAQEALGDRRRAAADLVIVLDDLELANAHQPDRVARVFCNAVFNHLGATLESGGFTYASTMVALKARVSFHLISPMVETWLFGDPGALSIAGVPTGSPVHAEPDLEAFETRDPAYLAATSADCPRIPAARAKKYRPKWLGVADRSQHPKGYVQWLCRNGELKTCTTYAEAGSGAHALRQLDWAALLVRPGSPGRYLRALLSDLAYTLGPPALDVVPEGAIRETSPFAVTSLVLRPQNHVLRNL